MKQDSRLPGNKTKAPAGYERRTIIFAPMDAKQLGDMAVIAVTLGWPHANRSTLVRALIRITASAYNDMGFPQSDLGIRFHGLLPAVLSKIAKESAATEEPSPPVDSKAIIPPPYERRTIIFGPWDSKQLDDLVRIGTYHRWHAPNRSTLVRALIRIYASACNDAGLPSSDLGIRFHEAIPVELTKIDKESQRPGVNPVLPPQPPQP